MTSRTIWNPGLQFMHALPFAAKARLIVGVFALPIALLGGALVERFLDSRSFTLQERAGVVLLQRLSDLNGQLLLQRDLARATRVGVDVPVAAQADGAAPSALKSETDFNRVDQAADQAGAAELLPAMQALQNAVADASRIPDALVAQGHAAEGLELVARVGDLSGLILDPDIDTLYLSLIALQVLPSMQDDLGNLRAWGSYLAAGPPLRAEQRNLARQQYSVWDAGLRSSMKRYASYVARVVAYNSAAAGRLPTDFLRRLDAYRADAYSVAMAVPLQSRSGFDDADRSAVAASQIWATGQPVQDELRNQYRNVLPLLDTLLQKRLDALWRTHALLLLCTVLALLVATYFFYAFYQDAVRDMAQQQVDEAQLRAAKVAAERANLAKSEFLANMSHEIRTPMNGVIGMTDLALALAQDTTQREYLQTAQGSAASLLTILNQILDFSEIEAGQLQLESTVFDPRALMTELGRSLHARLHRKGLVLVNEIAPQVPAAVLGDPGRLRQVLLNLSDNAIKFTQQGALTLRLLSSAQADVWHFEVSDTGIGIPAEKQKLIFEAFSQADTSTTREFGGTGLGLTICARLVSLMGGQIWVESVPGQGSRFHFTLPLATPAQSQAAAPARVQKRNILLVEDHPINQVLARTLLEKWGHRVTLAENGQQAVDLFHSARWDLILMDLQMPVMGGIEAAQRIRALEPAGTRVPIIAVTANSTESDRVAAERAGMDAHLSKPINTQSLQEMLTRFTTEG